MASGPCSSFPWGISKPWCHVQLCLLWQMIQFILIFYMWVFRYLVSSPFQYSDIPNHIQHILIYTYIHPTTSFSNILLWVVLGPWIGWTFNKKKYEIDCHGVFLTVHAKKVAFMKEVIDVMNYLIAKNRQNSFIIFFYI